MLAVPEVDDDVDVSSSVETTKLETTPTEPLPSPSTTNEENASSTSKQHISRLTHFQRNTNPEPDQTADRVTSHQQHHSAPPTQNQPSKTGLDAIRENAEDLPSNEQQTSINNRFPRSSTVPYPAYATLRKGGGNTFPSPHYYYTDNPTIVHGTVSPAQLQTYFNSRQPLTLLNTNFQPISPHHQFSTRPVDILKPTFLIVPKAAEQRLAAQLSASNSPTKSMTNRKKETKTTTTEQSPAKTTIDNGYQHVGLLATPNPSPYVHFVNVSYSTQSPQLIEEGPPETSVIQNDFTDINDYHQPSTSIRSMPNIALTQVSPHHLYGSPTFRHYYLSQQPTNEQEQQQPPPPQTVTTTESAGKPPPPIRPTTGRTRNETGETDESSIASLDFAQTDLVDMPGSWRYQPIPIRTVARRYRAPIPQSFIEPQQYVSDSEQVVRPSIYQQQQIFGSIPTLNRPFDSIRSQQPIQFAPIIRLNDKDILKIAAFYKSMGTLVYVAHSLATLYTSDFNAMANLKDWKKLYTGVPIWLFNTGINPKRARCIRLIISELGSSFTLWDTIVNGASDVRLPKSRHITLKSLETGTILALKFDDSNATDEFHQYFVKLSCDPRNGDLFDIFNIKRRHPKLLFRKRKIKKSAISKPSQFNHITKVDEHDRDSLYTFSVLVDDALVVA